MPGTSDIPAPSRTPRRETAGEHFTPREVIRLMVDLLFAEEDEDRMDENAGIAARFLNDADLRAVLTDCLVKKVHGDLTGPAAP